MKLLSQILSGAIIGMLLGSAVSVMVDINHIAKDVHTLVTKEDFTNAR